MTLAVSQPLIVLIALSVCAYASLYLPCCLLTLCVCQLAQDSGFEIQRVVEGTTHKAYIGYHSPLLTVTALSVSPCRYHGVHFFSKAATSQFTDGVAVQKISYSAEGRATTDFTYKSVAGRLSKVTSQSTTLGALKVLAATSQMVIATRGQYFSSRDAVACSVMYRASWVKICISECRSYKFTCRTCLLAECLVTDSTCRVPCN